MIDLFKHFKKITKFENVATDNIIFRLHYKITVTILLIFTVMVTTKQFFGDPIHCMNNDDKDMDKDAINSFCWIYGTFTLSSGQGVQNRHNAYGGIGNPHEGKGKEKQEIIYHLYYQWVCFVLIGQAFMFYIPRYMWKIWEGGRLKSLVCGLASPVVSKDWTDFRRGELLSYLSYTNVRTHNMYALRFAFCEILNFVNVIGQIFLLDVFLGGAFRNYGAAVANFTNVPRVPANMYDYASVNPMDQYFPKLSKCSINNYGPSGTLQVKDRLCVLPLNIINEKIFLVLWFWLIILAIFSGLSVIFRVLVLSLRQIRISMIMGQLRQFDRSRITRIVDHFGYGDWFILHSLGKNMNPLIYSELVNELSNNLDQSVNYDHKTNFDHNTNFDQKKAFV